MLSMLIYAASLSIQPSFKLNIHNQCLNIDLASPIYFTDWHVECHRPPDNNVYAGDTMKSGFIIKSDSVSRGALIYKLQRRSHESTKISGDTSSAACLLVIWEISESKRLCTNVLLVEHDKRLDWNKYDFKKLCLKYIIWHRPFVDPTKNAWLLNDNVSLMTRSEMMNGDLILNVEISEVERDNCTRIPLYIESGG
jgi:hypothetical protein